MRVFLSKINPGILLIIAALFGLIFANLPFGVSIIEFKNLELHIFNIDITVVHIIEDFILAFFFLAVGLELKLEFTIGSLKKPKEAIVPIIGAIGGVLVPAIIFISIVLFTGHFDLIHGFAIPSATDIAFSIGILAIIAKDINPLIRVFLLTLAVADDIAGIFIIAIGYSNNINFFDLFLVLLLCILWWICLKINIKIIKYIICTIIGLVAWYFMYQSGIHPAILGVILGLLVKSGKNSESFDHIEEPENATTTEFFDNPAIAFKNKLDPFSDLLVLPIFGFFMLAVRFSNLIIDTKTITLFLACAIALLFGKPIGIMLTTFLVTKFTPASLPAHLKLKDYLGVSCLAGTGFTVSFLICDLSYNNPEINDIARLGVMVGSFAAVLVSTFVFKIFHKKA